MNSSILLHKQPADSEASLIRKITGTCLVSLLDGICGAMSCTGLCLHEQLHLHLHLHLPLGMCLAPYSLHSKAMHCC